MNHPTYFIAEQGGGKTAKLLQWVEGQADIENIAVLCQSDVHVNRVKRSWDKKHPDGPSPRFMSYRQARSGMLDGRDTRIALDNLHVFLAHCFGYPVEMITTEGEAL